MISRVGKPLVTLTLERLRDCHPVSLRGCHPVSAEETGGCTQPVLLDISGRKVMNLAPGANDVSRLAPGVYFVRPASGAERNASSVSKVIVAH